MELNEIISIKVEKLREYVKNIKKGKEVEFSRFKEDWILHEAIIRQMQIAIECCLDIGTRLIAISNWKSPHSYREIIEILRDNKVLDEELAERFFRWVRFRNILVHEYLYIDLQKVYENIPPLIDDIEVFIKSLLRYFTKGDGRSLSKK